MMEIHFMGSDQRVVRAARVSFLRDERVDEERDKNLIEFLYKNKHLSPFEHCVVAFSLKREEFFKLLERSYRPDNLIYYCKGFAFLNLRKALENLRHLPEEVVGELKEKVPAVMEVARGKKPKDYSKDRVFLKRRIDLEEGFVALVDSLELGTDMDFFTFVVECPLFVARQWFRHRFGSFNEVSRRYTSKGISFYLPKVLRKQAKGNKQASLEEGVENGEKLLKEVESFLKFAKGLYDKLLEEGVARELARGVLPQFMKTRFYWTVPRISLKNFLSLRTKEDAQREIRSFALAIRELIEE